MDASATADMRWRRTRPSSAPRPPKILAGSQSQSHQDFTALREVAASRPLYARSTPDGRSTPRLTPQNASRQERKGLTAEFLARPKTRPSCARGSCARVTFLCGTASSAPPLSAGVCARRGGRVDASGSVAISVGWATGHQSPKPPQIALGVESRRGARASWLAACSSARDKGAADGGRRKSGALVCFV